MVRMVPARPATALHRLELLRIPGMKLLAHNNTFFTFSHLLLGCLTSEQRREVRCDISPDI